MAKKIPNIDFLPDRLNAEPIILFGISQSEMRYILLISLGLWVPLSLLIGGVLFNTFLGGLVLGISLSMLSVYVGAKKMQKIKRSKPEGAYIQQLRIWLHVKGIWKCPYIRYSGYWSIGRDKNNSLNIKTKK